MLFLLLLSLLLLICSANKWTGFYMITASATKELRLLFLCFIYYEPHYLKLILKPQLVNSHQCWILWVLLGLSLSFLLLQHLIPLTFLVQLDISKIKLQWQINTTKEVNYSSVLFKRHWRESNWQVNILNTVINNNWATLINTVKQWLKFTLPQANRWQNSS